MNKEHLTLRLQDLEGQYKDLVNELQAHDNHRLNILATVNACAGALQEVKYLLSLYEKKTAPSPPAPNDVIEVVDAE